MKYPGGVIYLDKLRVCLWIANNILRVQCSDITLEIERLPFFATSSKIDNIALGAHVCEPLIFPGWMKNVPHGSDQKVTESYLNPFLARNGFPVPSVELTSFVTPRHFQRIT